MRTAGRNAHLVLGACLAVFVGGSGASHRARVKEREKKGKERKRESIRGGMDAIEGDLMRRDIEAAVERDLSERT